MQNLIAMSSPCKPTTTMAISTKPLLFFLLFMITLLPTIKPDSNTSSAISELQSLQSQSATSLIHLNDNFLRSILTQPPPPPPPPPRPFFLLIFFDAKQLHNKPSLRLSSLKSHFSLVAHSFLTNNNTNNSSNKNKLFFCVIEFQESQSSFALFNVTSLPHIRLVGPNDKDLKKDIVQMDSSHLSGSAEFMAEFVEMRTGFEVGPIRRQPVVSKGQLMFVAVVLAILMPFMVKRLVLGNTLLSDWRMWLVGAVFVYFVSVSGAMHNLIREVPMFLSDGEKLMFFYQGSGMQLGGEGFAVGFLYTIVGLLLDLITHVLVRVRNVRVQRWVMIVALLVSFWAVKKVIFLDNWKTGYRIHAYWPSSWN